MACSCEHQTQPAALDIAANEDCAVDSNQVVFVREDGARSASAPDVAGAVAVATFALTPPPAGSLSAYEPSSRLLLELRPFLLSLRI
jgi:hypothetical protein